MVVNVMTYVIRLPTQTAGYLLDRSISNWPLVIGYGYAEKQFPL